MSTDIDTFRARLWLLISALLMVASAVCALGCSSPNCERFPDLPQCPHHAAGGAGGGGGGTSMGGGDAGTSVNCDDPTDMVTPAGHSCGVRVSSSTGNDDSADKAVDAMGYHFLPYQTFARALKALQPGQKHVYACGESFEEAVTLSSGVTLHGAFDCMKD